MIPDWMTVRPGEEPLIVSIPHAGTAIPADIEARLVSPWLGRKDADWWVDRLYDFAGGIGATVVRTAMSRTVIDVNRDPSGASLYPGQATTGLCPTETFDGELLYREGQAPGEAEIQARRAAVFDPYHAALAGQIERLRDRHDRIVLYEAHSIPSVVPRLFDGPLPNFNIGTNAGRSCDPALTSAVENLCDSTGWSRATNGRFKGGWTTRQYGEPALGVHAVQMELACRGYMAEPDGPLTPQSWPSPYDPGRAAPMRSALTRILDACIAFARSRP